VNRDEAEAIAKEIHPSWRAGSQSEYGNWWFQSAVGALIINDEVLSIATDEKDWTDFLLVDPLCIEKAKGRTLPQRKRKL